jgi:nitrogen fixation protein NifB
MEYLDIVLKQRPNIRVVGIAGPGDPFANVEQTLETLSGVHRAYPDIMLCVASNGLNIGPYIENLVDVGVSHVTITINAVNPTIGSRIYSWMRIGKRLVSGEEGAPILLERQLGAIKALKETGILVKVNAIVLPGINETHIPEIAKTAAGLGVDLFNCMPYFPCKGSALAHLIEPDPTTMSAIRQQAGAYLPQMTHCTRCRADAVGLLGEAAAPQFMQLLDKCRNLSEPSMSNESSDNRPYVAVATREGVLINQHLGEAKELQIFRRIHGGVDFVETRPAPEPGTGLERWNQLCNILDDCRMLLVSGVGNTPKKILAERGIKIAVCEGLIEEAVSRIYAGEHLHAMAVRKPKRCGASCGGDMMGCGA